MRGLIPQIAIFQLGQGSKQNLWRMPYDLPWLILCNLADLVIYLSSELYRPMQRMVEKVLGGGQQLIAPAPLTCAPVYSDREWRCVPVVLAFLF